MNRKSFILTAIILAGIIVALVNFGFQKQLFVAESRQSFEVETTYQEAVFHLANKNVLESTVSLSQGKILEKEWDNFQFNLLGFKNRLTSPNWIVDGRCPMLVGVNNDFVQKILHLVLFVYATPESMRIETKLIRASSPIENYYTVINLSKKENKVIVDVYIYLEYSHRHPFFLDDHVGTLVQKYTDESTAAICGSLEKVLNSRGIVIPLK